MDIVKFMGSILFFEGLIIFGYMAFNFSQDNPIMFAFVMSVLCMALGVNTIMASNISSYYKKEKS